jgi:hypothetical protein
MRSIQLNDNTAAEHNVMLSLREAGIDAQMHQTGGMNSACGVKTTSDGYFLVTYNWDGDGFYVVGEYDIEGAWIDNPQYFVTLSQDELVNHVVSLGNIIQIAQEG